MQNVECLWAADWCTGQLQLIWWKILFANQKCFHETMVCTTIYPPGGVNVKLTSFLTLVSQSPAWPVTSEWRRGKTSLHWSVVLYYTLKTGTPADDGDSILKLLCGVSRPEIQLGMGINAVISDWRRNLGKIISIQYGFSNACRLIWIFHIN